MAASTAYLEPVYSKSMLAPAVQGLTDLPFLTALACQEPGGRATRKPKRFAGNKVVWDQFLGEKLRQTSRLALDHFHLFEWFPLSPGRFHAPESQRLIKEARRHTLKLDGDFCYGPMGKAMMLGAGFGAVRLKPRKYEGTNWYLMTASSTGVCHEGFPVAVPEAEYEKVRDRIIEEGIAPIHAEGEMRFVPDDFKSLLPRSHPLLLLHVTKLTVLPARRDGMDHLEVTPVITFTGTFQNENGGFVSYNTFDPSQSGGLKEATDWLESAYVKKQFNGKIITHFDEQYPGKYADAVFGLPRILEGKLDEKYLKQAIQEIEMGWANAEKYMEGYGKVTLVVENNYGTVIGAVHTSQK